MAGDCIVAANDGTVCAVRSEAGSNAASASGRMVTAALAGNAPLGRFDIMNKSEKLWCFAMRMRNSLSQNNSRDIDGFLQV